MSPDEVQLPTTNPFQSRRETQLMTICYQFERVAVYEVDQVTRYTKFEELESTWPVWPAYHYFTDQRWTDSFVLQTRFSGRFFSAAVSPVVKKNSIAEAYLVSCTREKIAENLESAREHLAFEAAEAKK